MRQKYKLLLASTSKYRKILLEKMGVDFEVLKFDYEEKIHNELSGAEIVESIAKDKMDFAVSMIKNHSEYENSYILTCDTLIFCGPNILGKPKDELEARAQLNLLSGSFCQAITGICLCDTKEISCIHVSTDIHIADMSEDEKTDYVNSKEWVGIAGTIKLQGKGSLYVKSINGNSDNITGLPIYDLNELLKKRRFYGDIF